MSAILNNMAATEHQLRKALWMMRGWLLRCYLRLHGCRVGNKLKCKQWPTFRQVPNGNIRLGSSVTIGYRISLDVGREAILEIGNHVNLVQDLLISSGVQVVIGDYSGIGEYSSIRDGDHGYSSHSRIHDQVTTHDPIIIGSDVQISRGCLVTSGSRIDDGVIVGAGSVVTSRTKTIANGIYIGQPVKMIGKRP
ncbi:acyltransferase [bacterium]|nr:acyltransferase [bacterium]